VLIYRTILSRDVSAMEDDEENSPKSLN